MAGTVYAIDFETFYDDDNNLRKLGIDAYIRRPDFDAYLVSVCGSDGFEFVGDPREFNWFLIRDCNVLSHNARFDRSVYFEGVRRQWWPRVYYRSWDCTMERSLMLGLGASLKDAVKNVFGVVISKTVRDSTHGIKWGDMSSVMRDKVSRYCLDDARYCLQLGLLIFF